MTIVRKATAADLARLGRTAMHAFADDPVMRWFWPDDADFYAGDGAVMQGPLRRWIAHDHVFTTDDGVSLAVFVPPGRPEVEVPPGPSASPPSPELIARFVAIGEILAEHTPDEPHWYLQLLGTHPHWQRQGLGALVMAPVREMCDHQGVPMYLETETASNVAYYGHLGFTVRSEWDVPLDGPHMWGMIRRPQR